MTKEELINYIEFIGFKFVNSSNGIYQGYLEDNYLIIIKDGYYMLEVFDTDQDINTESQLNFTYNLSELLEILNKLYTSETKIYHRESKLKKILNIQS